MRVIVGLDGGEIDWLTLSLMAVGAAVFVLTLRILASAVRRELALSEEGRDRTDRSQRLERLV